MELRKDPITRSWVVTGDQPSQGRNLLQVCPFCPESPQQPQVISSMASVNYGPWSARAVVHPQPLYHVEGDPGRRGVGLYDVMRSVGAHEVIVENARHDRQLWTASDAEIEQFLLLCAHRAGGSAARSPVQVREHFQGFWIAQRTGVRPSDLADCGDDVRTTAGALRAAVRRASTTRKKSAASFATF